MDAISVGPWGCEEGTPFSHRINNGRIQKLVILYEGGFKSLAIKNAIEAPLVTKSSSVIEPQIQPANIIKNSNYRQGNGNRAYWGRRTVECTAEVISGQPCGGGDNIDNYVIVSKRKHYHDSIHQEITGEVCPGGVYEVSAYVSVKGGDGQAYAVCATVKLENMDQTVSYLHIGSVYVKNSEWKKLECWFNLNRVPGRVFFYVEGPPPEIDLLIAPVSILPVRRQFVVKLDPDEYLTGITGCYRKIQVGMSEVISSLTFLSNRTKYGPYGLEEGTPFSFKTNNSEIIGFYGTSGNYLNSVGCHLKPSESSLPTANVKKEH